MALKSSRLPPAPDGYAGSKMPANREKTACGSTYLFPTVTGLLQAEFGPEPTTKRRRRTGVPSGRRPADVGGPSSGSAEDPLDRSDEPASRWFSRSSSSGPSSSSSAAHTADEHATVTAPSRSETGCASAASAGPAASAQAPWTRARRVGGWAPATARSRAAPRGRGAGRLIGPSTGRGGRRAGAGQQAPPARRGRGRELGNGGRREASASSRSRSERRAAKGDRDRTNPGVMSTYGSYSTHESPSPAVRATKCPASRLGPRTVAHSGRGTTTNDHRAPHQPAGVLQTQRHPFPSPVGARGEATR
jgi:hypothetical protein